MFRWFKSTKTDEAIRAAVSQRIDPLAFGIAVSETAAEYFRAQKNMPISKFHDGESNVMEIWMGTRLEAISLGAGDETKRGKTKRRCVQEPICDGDAQSNIRAECAEILLGKQDDLSNSRGADHSRAGFGHYGVAAYWARCR